MDFCVGRVNARGEFMDVESTPMHAMGSAEGGCYVFNGSAIACRRSGLYGYTVRVLPHHADLTTSFVPGFIVWATTRV